MVCIFFVLTWWKYREHEIFAVSRSSFDQKNLLVDE
jgi:hypothetical protein